MARLVCIGTQRPRVRFRLHGCKSGILARGRCVRVSVTVEIPSPEGREKVKVGKYRKLVFHTINGDGYLTVVLAFVVTVRQLERGLALDGVTTPAEAIVERLAIVLVLLVHVPLVGSCPVRMRVEVALE